MAAVAQDIKPRVVSELHREMTQIEVALCRRSLRDFIREAWHVAEPGKPYSHGWHIDALADHLTYVSLGDIDNLLINIPPRHTKSLICAVFWPAWEWTWMPHSQWLFATYAQNLTVRDSVKCRRLIQSPWYQERWGELFALSGDQNLKTRFDNNRNGYRIATSVDGTATGEGGDRIVVDDAHNMKEIHSDVKREAVIEWWRDTMSTRANDPKTVGRVVIGQRGHHRDISGYLLSTGRWVHLNLPGYYRRKTHCITRALKASKRPAENPGDGRPWLPPPEEGQVLFADPRKVDDQLLAPRRFGPAEMAELAGELTKRGFAAQIQQYPTADEGNILLRKHWRRWEEAEPPAVSMVIQVYDTAFEEEEENDYSARTTWGIFEYEERLDPDLPWTAQYKGQTRLCGILLERWADRVGFPELRAEAIAAEKKWKPDRVLVEKKSSGHALAQELKRAGVPVARIRTRDSKVMKAHAASLVLERGCIFYMDRNWADEVIETCAKFPADEHDDLTDTVILACLWLRKRWKMEFLGEDDDDTDLMDQFRTDKVKRTYGGVAHA